VYGKLPFVKVKVKHPSVDADPSSADQLRLPFFDGFPGRIFGSFNTAARPGHEGTRNKFLNRASKMSIDSLEKRNILGYQTDQL